ncbi:hypothetical protein GTZ89_14855 [Streptomyces sp. SID8382]|uniref:hypothetical protein n=1 Tax=Streptomyces malaysiensis TaxID=92644 RepID=UPI000C2BB5BA|nr:MULTISPECIES: hypothetical protein [unclassified Streptomyces]AUA17204.1 hypothetical protein CFP59_09397 [Streptomyces sp. M56]MYX56941.1 hypothetical protein [Streptomyces sp. SID8382]
MLTGLSSGSAPELPGAELAALVRRHGSHTVDLRFGKGHRWETDGLAPFAEAGVDVAFIGVSVVLGGSREEVLDSALDAPLRTGVPVKVFAAPDCMAPDRLDTTRQQVDALADQVGGVGNVLVETHYGGESPQTLAALHAETGVRLLLDTLGLARISPDPLVVAGGLSALVPAAQVKGFDWKNPRDTRHLPLAETAGPTRTLLAALPQLARVTVETHAGSHVEDLSLINTWWRP